MSGPFRDTLEAMLNELPHGSVITKRAYSWTVELPTNPLYKSCGVQLEGALTHALDGEAEREIKALEAFGGGMFPGVEE